MNDRLILITNGMSEDKTVIKTSAPNHVIYNWCVKLNEMLEDGIGGYPSMNNYQYELIYDNELRESSIDEEQYLARLDIDKTYDLSYIYHHPQNIEILKEDRIGRNYYFLGERETDNGKLYVSGIIDKSHQDLGITKYLVNIQSDSFEYINSYYYQQLSNEAINLNEELEKEPKESFDKNKVWSIYMFNTLVNKVVVLDDKILNPEFQRPTHQLYLAVGGFGCRPEGNGNAVFAINLYSKQEVRLEKPDLLGVIQKQDLPNWAKESLKQIEQKNKDKGRER